MAKAKILLKRFPLSGSICFFVRVRGKDFVCEIFSTCFRNVTEYIEESITYLLKSQVCIETKIIQKIQDKISENYDIYERYSCGYGDYLLSCQANICTLLKANKIGVNLTNGGMFIPTKTISAVIGIKGEKNV